MIPHLGWFLGGIVTGLALWGFSTSTTVVALIVWWFYQSATQFDPKGWWKLRSEISVGTAVIQIAILAIVLFLTNTYWVKRLKKD